MAENIEKINSNLLRFKTANYHILEAWECLKYIYMCCLLFTVDQQIILKIVFA